MKSVMVQNVLWSRPTGYAGSQDFNNYSDIRLKIKVQTVQGGVATLYSSFDKTYTQNAANNTVWFQESIRDPLTGSIVVQVEEIGLECVLAQSNCTGVKPSKQEFFSQQTYSNGIPPSFVFPLIQADLIAELCCP